MVADNLASLASFIAEGRAPDPKPARGGKRRAFLNFSRRQWSVFEHRALAKLDSEYISRLGQVFEHYRVLSLLLSPQIAQITYGMWMAAARWCDSCRVYTVYCRGTSTVKV
jgi:hypothetical protein